MYSINPTTGQQTFLFSTGVRLAGLTSPTPIPEPSAFGLFAIGFGTVGFSIKRRRRMKA